MKKKKKNKRPPGKVDKVLTFCKEVIDVIQKENGLSDYRIKIIYQDDDERSRSELATINVDNEYIRATITIFPVFIEMYLQGKHEELIEALCHEIFHIKMSTIDDLANNRWGSSGAIRSEIERLTEIYDRMIYKVMNFESRFKKFKNPNAITHNKKGR